jgi:hypothetical protein
MSEDGALSRRRCGLVLLLIAVVGVVVVIASFALPEGTRLVAVVVILFCGLHLLVKPLRVVVHRLFLRCRCREPFWRSRLTSSDAQGLMPTATVQWSPNARNL